ncbi:hypothetical protein ADEAN_000487200 [Angomonas deanei]|uniref:Uncharacterized protein n=1 Tax=Angomonas deanei TaxID=59799 RepID=A0A7G2CEV3_9TRYP|nr:hypothetical protein ADEAN_000487200 [Angomonas deanei]
MDHHLFRWVHPLSRIMQSQLGAMYSPTSSLSRLGAESLQFFVLYDHVDHHQTLTHLAGVFQQMAKHSKMQREKDEAWYEDDPKGPPHLVP